MARFTSKLGGVLFGIGILNFLAFMVISQYLGGSAPNGKIEGSSFFLGSRGNYTEVSSELWYYSQYHAITTVVGLILGVTGLAIYGLCESQQKSESSLDVPSETKLQNKA